MKAIIFSLVVFMSVFRFSGKCAGEGDANHVKAGCAFSRYKVDEATGATVKIMEREPLFSHAGAQANSSAEYVVDEPITAQAYLANYNNEVVFYLRLEILSAEAHDHYGSIFAGDKLMFKLSNDETVTLEAGKSEIGQVQENITSYAVFYPVSQDELSMLRDQPLTKVRVHWSNGYMDYQIDNREFFIRQLSCVE